MTSKYAKGRIVAVLALSALAASAASAASNITNALTGFTGNSTQTATQNAVAAAGFQFTSTQGLTEVTPGNFIDPTVTFDSSGAAFGSQIGGDPGRNFMRTVADDYDNHSFTAEVTWVTSFLDGQAAYFGLGAAEYGTFRIADWATQNSTVHLFLEVDSLDPTVFTLKNRNGVVTFDAGTEAVGLAAGNNRLRMTYDWFAKTAQFQMDLNYAGGPFAADVTLPPVSTLDLYGPTGFSAEPGRMYFGGDDSTTFKDFQVTVTQPGTVFGDLTTDGAITSADWVLMRSNQLGNFSGDTFMQAYFKGDLTADKLNNHADFALFKGLYDAANGVGSFDIMAASVPEPATAWLMAAGALAAGAIRVRRRR